MACFFRVLRGIAPSSRDVKRGSHAFTEREDSGNAATHCGGRAHDPRTSTGLDAAEAPRKQELQSCLDRCRRREDALRRGGQGAPFVLIHGGGASSSGEVNYYDVIGPLGKKFHVIAPDIVGFGYTAPRGAQDYSGKAQGDHLVRFIEALDVGPVYLNGNSHGGYLVQYAALERPDLVRRLVITNSLNGTFPIPELPEGASYIYAPGGHQYSARTVEQTRASLARFYFHEDLVTEERVQLVHDIYMRNYGYADKRGRAVSYSVEASNTNLSYKGKHITEWAGELQMPVLLMWSEPGSKIEWGVAHFFRIPGAEMHLFPWSGHHLFADQRDRWLQVVTSWLNNEPARRPNVAR